ncbi:MAG: tetratricopeptide repeat protein [Synergistetes bacterium]|nr:tetratricopeptide repeat protein [Synergistota bacterium]
MRKVVLLIVIMGVLFCSVSALALAGRMRVAVIDFRNNVSGPERPKVEAVRRAITDMFITELWKTQMFSIVERSRLEAIAREHRLAASGLVDEATAARLGKLLGVEAIITGSITQFTLKKRGGVLPVPNVGGIAFGEAEAFVTLDVRMINVETGEIVLVAKETGRATHSVGGLAFGGVIYGQSEAEGLLAAATRQCIEKIVKKIRALRARGGKMIYHVIKREAGYVYLDAGESNAGVSPGDYFAVYVEGEPIYGVKGELLGVEKYYIAILQVQEVHPRYSIARIVKGKGVIRGDKVEPIFDKSSIGRIKIRPRILAGASSTPSTPPPPPPPPSGGAGTSSPPPPPPPPSTPTESIMNTSTTIQVIKLYPIGESLKNNLIRLHKAGYYNYRKRRYSLAIRNYKLAYEMYKGNYVACYWIGRIYYEIGRRSEAIKWWRRGLKINPNYKPIREKLAKAGAL